MLFNIHHGQARLRYGKMEYIPKSPKSSLTMQNWDKGIRGDKITYTADKFGNIDIVQPRHIETMVGLGYPIYGGDGKLSPVPFDDLLFPTLNLDGEYWRRISQALGKEVKLG